MNETTETTAGSYEQGVYGVDLSDPVGAIDYIADRIAMSSATGAITNDTIIQAETIVGRLMMNRRR